MSTSEWIVVAVAALVLVVIVVLLLSAWSRARSRARLRDRFGPEYDRTVQEVGSTSKAADELQQREQRHDALGIHPLESRQRAKYQTEWSSVQARFVDDPRGALGSADSLVTSVMADRGYPTGDFDQRAADLSVEHGDVLDHYRAAHVIDLREGKASTEQMREAMVHYRSMFDELLGESVPGSGSDGKSEASR